MDDDVSCTDGDACTLGEVCSDGECTAAATALCGPPVTCAGGAPCTPSCVDTEGCQSDVGCVDVTLTGTPCNDGEACHILDECMAGICAPLGPQLSCDDGNPCTEDVCDPSSGCAYEPAPGPCDDGDPCTIGDHCEAGACEPESQLVCDDGKACTTGTCVPGTGCTFTFNTDACEDGDPCTEGDKCQGGQCKPGDKVCPCNEDANCNPAGGGTCAGVWHCIANQCVLETAAAVGCPGPPDPCVQSFCNLVSGSCVSEKLGDGSPCDDGDACTAGDTCLAGVCTPGPSPTCDDGNPCTKDSCLSGECAHEPTDIPCEDGDPCTTGDVCVDGTCQKGAVSCACQVDADCAQPVDLCQGVVRCVDGGCEHDPESIVACPLAGLSSCLATACDPSTGQCVATLLADGSACEDGDACTQGDLCIGGACSAGAAVSCDDGNPCTTDGCATVAGCFNAPSPGPCNDGNPCTTDETCTDGSCQATSSVCLELCDNQLDDDGDGAVDCDDPACAALPGCDACALAQPLKCGAGGVPGAVGDLAPSHVGDTSCGPGGNPDRIFRFTTNASGQVAVTLTVGTDAFALRVLTAGEAGGCDPLSCKAGGTAATFLAVAGAQYHIVVEKLLLGGASSFVINLTCAEPCVPACADADCGSDGCGGVCGSCGDGDPCTQDVCDGGTCAHLPTPGCCLSAADCSDGDPCTADVCTQSTCEFVALPNCCSSDASCDDGVPCTTDVCGFGAKCQHLGAAGCCTSDADCALVDPCASAVCLGGSCKSFQPPGCCTSDADCVAVGTCEEALCVDGACLTSPLPGCCAAADDCSDGDPCTHDSCDVASETCAHTVVPGCCQTVADCPTDSDPCTSKACIGGTCTQVMGDGCCQSDAECPWEPPCQLGVCVVGLCTMVVASDCCSTDQACDDGNGCTADHCLSGDCVHQSILGCCLGDVECDDGDPCTADECLAGVGADGGTSGACSHVVLDGCCVDDAECADGDPCTTDACGEDGACKHEAIAACCSNAFDCETGPCVEPACVESKCHYSAVPGCCQSDADCLTESPCVTGKCVGGKCNLLTEEACCVDDGECPVPEGPCQKPRCKFNVCDVELLPGCCVDDASCGSAAGPCQAVSCLGHECITAGVPGCCVSSADCPAPKGTCGLVECVDGVCEPAAPADLDSDCCSSVADCPSSDSCYVSNCVAGACVSQPTADCCVVSADCPGADDPCVVVECILGACVETGSVPGCCDAPADCPVPDEACKQRDCTDNICVFVSLPGCCETVADCPAPKSTCSSVSCVDSACAVASDPQCCAEDSDCSDDGNVCTTVSCQAGACTSEPVAGCCAVDADCSKFAEGACAQAKCVLGEGSAQGSCFVVTVPGCCASKGDCPPGGPCEAPACSGGECSLTTTVGGCCASDSDCPEDPDPCTLAQCLGGKCGWAPVEGCCGDPLDCPLSKDPCLISACSGGTCAVDGVPGCAVGACAFFGFDALDAPGWTMTAAPGGAKWLPTAALAFAGDGSLNAAFGTGGPDQPVATTTPWVSTSGDAMLRFRYRMELQGGDCQSGSLHAYVEADDGLPATNVWSSCLQTLPWKLVTVDLSPWSGATVRVRFELSAGAGLAPGAAWLDDVAVSGDCALTCEGACDDGDPCTANTCVAGVCGSAPIFGCCMSDLACADDDPCTLDACIPVVGCQHVPIAGCIDGACEAATFTAGPGADGAVGWSFTSDGDAVAFKHSVAGSLSPGGHLIAQAGPGSGGLAASAALPRLLYPQSKMSIRFALRQSTGAGCALGQLFVVVGDQEVAVPCGLHDWQIMSADFDVAAPALVEPYFRLDVVSEGAQVELDDVRVVGACHLASCTSSTDCTSGEPCTLASCGPDYQCTYAPVAGCCAGDADCTDAPVCSEATCVDGACVYSSTPGCDVASCWFAAFEAPLSDDWEVTGTPSGSVLWTVDDSASYGGTGALHGHYESLGLGGGTATATPPHLFVGSGGTILRFRYRLTTTAAGCAHGGLELWVGGELTWLTCKAAFEWTTAEVSLGSWAGTVVQPQFRLRSGGVAGSHGDAWIDDLGVSGDCSVVSCADPEDCDDGNACTLDACVGWECLSITHQGACDDGDSCTVGDECVDGACVAAPLVCDDGEECTLDLCDPTVGCVFIPGAASCDDGNPCTAGDVCQSGVCAGTPLLCKDFNGCTVDGCTPGVGCEFVPKAWGTACSDGGATNGVCWDGVCADWEITSSEVPGSTAADTRAYAATERVAPLPILVAGTHNPDGLPRAAVFRVDQTSLALVLEYEESPGTAPALSTWVAMSGPLLVGTDGLVSSTSSELDPPSITLAEGLDWTALDSAGASWFVGGDGSAVAAVRSNLRRCKNIAGDWGPCHVMPIVHSPGFCNKQVTFHVRDVHAISTQQVLIAGFSVEKGGETVARVAVWDGNTANDCPGLGVYSGEAYTDDPANVLTLAVDEHEGGAVESIEAIGTSGAQVWAAGLRGAIHRFDGQAWVVEDPAVHAAAAGWSVQHDVRALHATPKELHLVGDGVGITASGCRTPFYLHATRVGDSWVFDRLDHFGPELSDCGTPPYDYVALRDVSVDALTGDLYIVGWSPDAAGSPSERRGLVMRLKKP